MTTEQYQDNPKTAQELDLEFRNSFIAEVRVERNKRLAETDYIYMPDVEISGEFKNEMIKYRQQLRDFITTVDKWLADKDLYSVSIWGLPWPEKPKA